MWDEYLDQQYGTLAAIHIYRHRDDRESIFDFLEGGVK
jgi:hypothetical protein